MTAFPGAPSVLGSPKGGEDKPEPRKSLYAMQRCSECTLVRKITDNGMCEECRQNINSFTPNYP